MPAHLKRPRALAALAVILAAGVPYLSTLHDYFLQDDFGVVWLLSQKPWWYFPRWFTGPWTEDIWAYVPDEVRPFPAVTFQIAALWGGGSPVANHVINIALHAANALLVFWIAETAAGLTLTAAAVAGIVFAVLPIQAESVAWVTGRVDSLPAFAYFAAFMLYASWRSGAGRSAYVGSLVMCFVALFSKQNTITLAPALVLYDLLIVRARIRPLWRWLGPYLPYVALTAGFLLLRYLLFGEVARENILTAQRFDEFTGDVSRHLRRLIFGDAYMGISWARAITILAVGLASISFIASRYRGADARRLARSGLYFGIVWMVLGVAPILVSGYYSPRHMYLASLGWAVVCGIAFDVLYSPLASPDNTSRRADPWGPPAGLKGPLYVRLSDLVRRSGAGAYEQILASRVLRLLAVTAAAAIIAIYAVQLRDVVRGWSMHAAISKTVVAALEREALTMPEGTLVIVGVPRPSWAFALPYAAQPPFTATDVSRRLFIISDSLLHCCPFIQWNQYTRHALLEWKDQAQVRPVVALRWDARTGTLARLEDREEPYLRPLMSILLDTGNGPALDEAITDSLNALVVPRGQ